MPPFRAQNPARPSTPPLHVVLVEPEIPPNTGNIARLSAATACPLHLVGRLGFRIDAHAVRRAGLDYWDAVELHQHVDLAAAEANIAARRRASSPFPRTHLFTTRARHSYLDVPVAMGDVLVFGCESRGLPEAILDTRPDNTVGIPLLGDVRSLNLSNAVSIAVFEFLRRLELLR
ncbi:MAG TPA: tRNA (cytidine(34)-2'-O)-methyltransferase [Polyangiaceae bacterium]|nr:tRNA (cytidine(34)-2'-O)-methyltransferase [Polyangiaceae bacterium]